MASGTITTTHLDRGDLPARLKVLFDGISEVRARYQPDVAAVEIVFVNVNPQATLLLGQARGACVTALVACNLAVAEYTALQMKQAVAGYGKAGKAEVQQMVKRLLQLPGCRARMRPMRWVWRSRMPTWGGDGADRDCGQRWGASDGDVPGGRGRTESHRGLEARRDCKRGPPDQLSRRFSRSSDQHHEEPERRDQRPLQHDQPEALVARLAGDGIQREADAAADQQQQQDQPAKQQHRRYQARAG